MNLFRRWQLDYPASLRGARSRETSRITSYVATTRLFVAHAVRVLRWDIPRVVLIGLCGLGAQVGALAVLLLVVRHVERGLGDVAMATVGGFSVGAQQVFVFALCICLLLIVSASLQYVSQREEFRVLARYEREIHRTLLEVLAHLPSPGAGVANTFLRGSGVQRLLGTAPRAAAIVLHRALGVIVPFAQSVCALAVLFHLDAPITLGVLGILSIATIAIYAINIEAVSLSRRMEEVGPALSLERRSMLSKYFAANAPGREKIFWQHALGDTFSAAQDTFYGRLLVIDRSRFAAAVGAALVLALVLATKGYAALFGAGSVTALIAYVIALQYFSGGVRSITGMLTAINRFYPQIARIVTFLRLRDGAVRASSTSKVLVEATDLISGRRSKLELLAGTRICLLARRSCTRDTVVDLVEHMRIAGGPPALGFLSLRIGAPGVAPEPDTSEVLPSSGEADMSGLRLVVMGGACTGSDPCPDTITEIYSASVPDHKEVGFAAYDKVLFVREDGEIMYCAPAWAETNARELKRIVAARVLADADAKANDEEFLNEDEF